MACIDVKKTEAYTHDNGDTTYIYVARNWTYRAKRSDGSTSGSSEKVYISYAGSQVTNSVEFSGPTEVVIQAGKSYVDFEIYIYHVESAHHKFLLVSGTSPSMASCGVAKHQILSHKSTPGGTPEDPNEPEIPYIRREPYCCDYFESEYDLWNKKEEEGCMDFFKGTPFLYPEGYKPD